MAGNLLHQAINFSKCCARMRKQVAVLRCMDAAPSTVWTGQPYTSKGLQQWKAGRPHAMDLHPRTTTNSKELLFNDGLYI